MYGTGFRDALDGDAAWVVEQLADWPGEIVVAVDIPSGVDGLTGAVPGAAVRADRTVTFAARKPGLVFEPGRSYAGEIVVADIGIVVDDVADVDRRAWSTGADVAAWLPGARARRAQVAVGRADGRRVRRHDRCAACS